HLDRAAAEGRRKAAAGALGIDAQRRQVVEFRLVAGSVVRERSGDGGEAAGASYCPLPDRREYVPVGFARAIHGAHDPAKGNTTHPRRIRRANARPPPASTPPNDNRNHEPAVRRMRKLPVSASTSSASMNTTRLRPSCFA